MKSRVLMLVAGALMLAGVTAKATVADNFAGLLTELQIRSQALSNFVAQVDLEKAVRKTRLAEKKACDKAIQTINKASLITNSTATAKGLIAAGQVTSALRKPFADELGNTNVHFQVGNFTSTHNLRVLLSDTFTAFANDVEGQLGDVDLSGITGAALAKIEAAIAKANAALHDAGLETDFAKATRFISNALKSTVSALKGAIAAHSKGGGGNTGGAGMHCKINGVSFSAPALGTVGVYLAGTGELAITGATATKAVSIIAADVTGPGDYPASLCTVSEFTDDVANSVNFLSNQSGTIHITAFTPGGNSASGTFSFSASQSTPTANPDNVVNVTEGTFSSSTIINY